ncbi:DNA topoisomerase 1 [candidate division SR1 bacterium]|nr:DNA topoisomerase 1 [candidate division SR1 bacterium]
MVCFDKKDEKSGFYSFFSGQMAKNLVIVESPAKSKTIAKFLGSDYEVHASYGHVVDLPTKGMGIDIKNGFQPEYVVSPDKKRVISDLKKLAKGAKVWIATDEDREGEAIGRHVANELGLDIKTAPRIVFHEITEKAIKHAVENPRTLDMSLVDAQQARRVLDRLVGFELSPVLWKKIKTGLSAGRVQSVAVELLVEREREIQKHESESSFKIVGTFVGDAKKAFDAEYNKSIKKPEDVEKLFETLKNSAFSVSSIEVKPGKKSPSAPFTTSTLQQEASRKLGFSVSRTMQVAQKLYEAGLITYMRTDSVNLSDFAVEEARNEILKAYGKDYSKPTHYATKSKGAQEAHECIRPTHFESHSAGSDASEKKLYELIWKRAVASQMSPAEIEKTKAVIEISGDKGNFVATGEVVKFDGFLKLYFEGNDEEDDGELAEGMLPKLTEGESLKDEKIVATEKFTNHKPRYTEASLVKELESRGIGRPSTYASIISTVQKRGYVVLEDRPGKQRIFREISLINGQIASSENKQNYGAEKKKLFPTDVGMVVTDFLIEHFPEIMDYQFTANAEDEFDIIAEGKLKWQDMIQHFYDPFHVLIEKTADIARANAEREIGTDPKSGKPIIARIGRYGPLLQIGTAEDEAKKFANIPSGLNIETITLEEALKAFELPREIGEREGKMLKSNIGRFGPYVQRDKTYASIKKDAEFDVFSITYDQAAELIKEKKNADANKYIAEFEHKGEKIEVLNGPYGPYVKYKKKNYKIPKGGKDATDLKLHDVMEIVGVK